MMIGQLGREKIDLIRALKELASMLTSYYTIISKRLSRWEVAFLQNIHLFSLFSASLTTLAILIPAMFLMLSLNLILGLTWFRSPNTIPVRRSYPSPIAE